MSDYLYIDTDRTRGAVGHLRTMADRGDETATTIAIASSLAALPDSGGPILLAVVDTLRTLAGILAERRDEVDAGGLLPYRPSGRSLDDLRIGGVPIGDIPLDDWVEALGDLDRPLAAIGAAIAVTDLYQESHDIYDNGTHREWVTAGLAAGRTAFGAGAGAAAESVTCNYGGAVALEMAPELGPLGPMAVCLVAAPIVGAAVQDDALEVWDFIDEHSDEVADAVTGAYDAVDDAWDWGIDIGHDFLERPTDHLWPLQPIAPSIDPGPVIDDLSDVFGGLFDVELRFR